MKNTRNSLAYWLALLRTPGLGPRQVIRLLESFSGVMELFKISKNDDAARYLSKETRDYLAHPDWDAVEHDLTWSTQPGHHIISLDSIDYPSYLREIASPPIVLYVKGQLACLQLPQIAVVGTRHPSFSGQETAFNLGYQLAKAGIVVTSGLARGIDSHGHRGALKADGHTIAVLGSGIDYIYPKENVNLAQTIAEQGAIVSEFPPNTPPLPKHFPQRNRVISGLSRGVVVIEAALKSGSLVTARLANEQGREVFAVPGSIYNVVTQGCHALIQQGAKLITCLQDILDELVEGDVTTTQPAKKIDFNATLSPNFASVEEQIVWNCLDFEPATVDVIVCRSGLGVSEVCAIVQSFVISDVILSTVSGYCHKSRSKSR